MIRTALFVLATLALAGLAAWAQSTVPESDDSRYTFNRVDDGYLRLDGRTGQVSICARRPVGWTCEAVPDERAALEAEIARLQGGLRAICRCLAPSSPNRRRACRRSLARNCPTMLISTRS